VSSTLGLPELPFFGFPAAGHTIPSLALVRALVAHGLQVVYHGSERFRGLIEETGARVIAYSAEADERLARPADLADHLATVAEVGTTLAPALLPGSAGAPLVIFDGSATWGLDVARRLGVPGVASITTFAFTQGMLRLLGAGAWPACEGAIVRGDLKVVYTSRELQPGGRYFDDSFVFVGPDVDERPELGPRVEPTSERPLAYISLGTIFNSNRNLLRQCAAALGEAGFEVVVSLGDTTATVDGDWPAGTRVYPLVGQCHILRRTALFVTHAGLNSASEALALGVPLIAIPQEVDQYVVARRVAGLGAAVVVDRDTATPRTILEAARRIQAERAAFDRAASAIGRTLSEATPIETAAQRILELASCGGAGPRATSNPEHLGQRSRARGDEP